MKKVTKSGDMCQENPTPCYRLACIKPGEWSIIHTCVWGIYSACVYTIFWLNIETFLIFYPLLHVELEFPNIYVMFEQYDFKVTLLVMDI